MAIFGRITARQRLRRAAQESLAIPPFGSAVDCTPWVVGELWPAELSTITPENASVARYLRAELDRIVRSANEQLRTIRRAGATGPAQQAEEARVVDGARALAAQRVEAALRQLDKKMEDLPTDNLPTISPGPGDGPSAEDTQRLPVITVAAEDPADEQPAIQEVEAAAQPESDQERLHRLVEFMARQEPGLCWAAGDRENGITVVATDLAEGWIPPGIAVPPDVRLLPPQRRTGDAVTILGPTTVSATYAPGDPLAWSFGWATEFDPAAYSVRARRLPTVDDLGWLLAGATHMRDGLPRMVHTLAKAAAAKTPILETEIEELRVHLETARLQLLAQYPEVDHAALLNCLLLAAAEGMASGDRLTANYHFAWYQALNAPLPKKRSTR
ncbi:DUF5631 domain-containing protein [Mycobacterium kyorinense]|uniref:Vegetative cell wall protein n=1 Tax=Mycobacterium kyorinense TaxID=487514 RepID=A0A1X1XS94_9MYCO|nr:DUF5631 domain-containing protein [Mycobacterium kyorinense]ORW01716.1 hypothetical protein AWC14_07835 [Mycobacterium kyorinense]